MPLVSCWNYSEISQLFCQKSIILWKGPGLSALGGMGPVLDLLSPTRPFIPFPLSSQIIRSTPPTVLLGVKCGNLYKVPWDLLEKRKEKENKENVRSSLILVSHRQGVIPRDIQMISKFPSNPSHSVIPWFCGKDKLRIRISYHCRAQQPSFTCAPGCQRGWHCRDIFPAHGKSCPFEMSLSFCTEPNLLCPPCPWWVGPDGAKPKLLCHANKKPVSGERNSLWRS